MNPIVTLAKLEVSRHRLWKLEVTGESITLVTAIYFGLVLFGMFFMWLKPSPAMLFPLAPVVVAATTLILGFMGVHVTAQPQEREWWLSFPYPRRHFVWAKWLATVQLGGRALVLVGLACATVYLLSWPLYGGSLVPSSVVFHYALNSLLLAVSLVPVTAAAGVAFVLFLSGVARVGNVLFGLLFGAGGGLAGATLAGQENKLLSPAFVLHAFYWTLAIGVPAALVLLWLAPIGLRRLGDAHLRTHGSPTAPAVFSPVRDGSNALNTDKFSWASSQPRRAQWIALWRYEMSRYRWLSKRAPMSRRIISWIVTALLLVGGFIAPFWRDAPTISMSMWMLFSSMLSPLMIINLTNWDFAKGLGLWWMSFPVSREKLLTVRVLSVIGMAAMYSFTGLGCLIVGVALHSLIHPVDTAVLQQCWQYLWRVLLVFLIISPIITFISLFSTACYHSWRVIFFIPIYLVAVNGPNYFIIHWVMPDELAAGPHPEYWLHMGMAVGIGLPLAVAALIAGASTLHMMTQVKTYLKWR